MDNDHYDQIEYDERRERERARAAAVSRPSDRAIAAAWNELAATATRHLRADEFASAVQQRAAELDASGPQGAEAVATVVVDAEVAVGKNGIPTRRVVKRTPRVILHRELPPGTPLYTRPPVESAPSFVGWWREDAITPYSFCDDIGVMLAAGWKPVGIISPEAMQAALAAAQENAP